MSLSKAEQDELIRLRNARYQPGSKSFSLAAGPSNTLSSQSVASFDGKSSLSHAASHGRGLSIYSSDVSKQLPSVTGTTGNTRTVRELVNDENNPEVVIPIRSTPLKTLHDVEHQEYNLSEQHLVEFTPPVRVFSPSDSIFPEGAGLQLGSRFVAEPLNGDYQTESLVAFHEVSMATEVMAMHNFGLTEKIDQTLLERYPRVLIDYNLGLKQGRPIKLSEGNARRIASLQTREFLHEAYLGKRTVSEATRSLEDSLGDVRSVLRLARRMLPAAAWAPIDDVGGRPTAVVDHFEVGTGHPASVGCVPSTIGALSVNVGGVNASTFDVQSALAETNPDISVPTLRIVRPLQGDATDMALSATTPAILSVESSGVEFRDHPLFSTEDYVASQLRARFAEYVHHVRTSNIVFLDARLRALLAFTHPSVASVPLQSISRSSVEFDFEHDSLPQLCARASAVLEALSLRIDEVRTVSSSFERCWAAWSHLRTVRRRAGFTSTSLQLFATEVVSDSAEMEAETRKSKRKRGSTVAPPPLYQTLHGLQELLLRLHHLATTSPGVSDSELEVSRRLLSVAEGLLADFATAESRGGRGALSGPLGSCVGPLIPLLRHSIQQRKSLLEGTSTHTDTNGFDGYGNFSSVQDAFPGAVEFYLRLEDSGSIDPDEAVRDAAELARRRRVRATEVMVEVLVNGRAVARGPPAPLRVPGFVSSARVAVALKLYRLPSSISLRVLSRDSIVSRYWPRVLSEVLVPVPGLADARRGGLRGIATSALDPTRGTFEFFDPRPIGLPLIKVPQLPSYDFLAKKMVNPLNSSSGAAEDEESEDSEKNQPLAGQFRLLSGAVSATAAWHVPKLVETGLKHQGVSVGEGPIPISASSESADEAQSLHAGRSERPHTMVAVPSFEYSTPQTQPGFSAVVSAARALSVRLFDTLWGQDPARENSGGASVPPALATPPPRARLAASLTGRVASGTANVGLYSATRFGSSLGVSSELLQELASVSVPRALLGPISAAPMLGSVVGVDEDEEDFGEVTHVHDALSEQTQANTLANSNAFALTRTRKAGGLMSQTRAGLAGSLRRSDRAAAVSDAILTAQTLTALVPSKRGAAAFTHFISVSGVDPHDPRAARLLRARATAARGPFRLRALDAEHGALGPSSSLSEIRRQAVRALGARGAYAGSSGLTLGSSGLSQLFLRLQVLRMRGERPGLFRGKGAVPLRDAEVSRSRQWSEFLKVALLDSGSAPEELEELFRAIAGAIGIRVSAQPGSRISPLSSLFKSVALGQPELFSLNRGLTVATANFFRRLQEFMDSVRAQPTARARTPFASVVREASVPLLNRLAISTDLSFLFAPRRALRPIAVDLGHSDSFMSPLQNARQAPLLPLEDVPAVPRPYDLGPAASLPVEESARTHRIVVQVIRARNLPARKQSSLASEPINCVVEARFQDVSSRTHAVRGSMPHWDEVLVLPFSPPHNDPSPAALAAIVDDLKLVLYDERASEAPADPSRPSSTTIVHRYRHFLGLVSVPFSALWSQGGLKAELRLDSPMVNLNYAPSELVHEGYSGQTSDAAGATQEAVRETQANQRLPRTTGDRDLSVHETAAFNARMPHLYVHVSFDPPLFSGEEAADEDGDGEDDVNRQALAGMRVEGDGAQREALEFAARWSDVGARMLESVVSSGGKNVRLPRTVRAVVPDVVNKAVLVTQYLEPLQLPPSLHSAGEFLFRKRAHELLADHIKEKTSMNEEVEPLKDCVLSLDHIYSDRQLDVPMPLLPGFGTPLDAKTVVSNAAAGFGALVPKFPAFVPTSDSLVPQSLRSSKLLMESELQQMDTVEQLARFVSLIPYLTDSQAFSSGSASTDRWATAAESFRMGASDDEERAVLLHNYLLQLYGEGGSVRVFIVLGRAVPKGETVWVLLTWSGGRTHSLLIDPCTGLSYSVRDAGCPLRSIGMLATKGNAWANIQPFTDPWRVEFDVTRTAEWRPLEYPEGHKLRGQSRHSLSLSGLRTIQRPVPYCAPDIPLAAALEHDIALQVIFELQRWRRDKPTNVTYSINRQLRALLLQLEMRRAGIGAPFNIWTKKGVETVLPEGQTRSELVRLSTTALPGQKPPTAQRHALAADERGYGSLIEVHRVHLAAISEALSVDFNKVRGFTLNFSFTTFESIAQVLHATALHSIDHDHVQFSVGTAVVPYPNNIFSVWLYLIWVLP